MGGLCSICGERIVSGYALESEDIRCGICRRVDPPFAKAVAYGSYESGLRDLIHMLKYQQVRPAANVLGRMLAEVIAELQAGWYPAPVLVVPVPLFSAKLRQRGFNQAVEIARMLAKQTGLALSPRGTRRVKDTTPQAELPYEERARNIRGAFACDVDLSGKRVAVLDDVMTTGATLNELAKVLKRAGAVRVENLVIARSILR